LGRLGPYRVIGVLGEGGMGQVFLAKDSRLKRHVALKVMHEKVPATRNSKRRFVEEARSMAAVHHDNVATIFEVGLHAGMPFLAMEVLKGNNLDQWLAEGRRLTTDEILRLAADVSAGLAAAHEGGIVHRDIKPANIWIEESGRAKILDFGLAISGEDRFSRRGSVIGTPGFLSPEQARNEPLDDRTDLYSLGVVLYRVACGRLPLRSDSITGQMIAIIAHQPRPLCEVDPQIPEPLSELVARLLAKEPRDRPRSAARLCREVQEVATRCREEAGAALRIETAPAVVKKTDERKRNLRTAAPPNRAADEPANESATAEPAPPVLPKWWWGRWAASLMLLALLTTVAVIRFRPTRTASSPVPSPASSTRQAEKRPVRATSLQVLSLSPRIEGPRQVDRGDAATFRLELVNGSADDRHDPTEVYRGRSEVAQVVIYFKIAGKVKNRAKVYPRKFSARELPSRGSAREFEMLIDTREMQPGEFEVIFELQAPEGGLVSSNSVPLTVADPPPTSAAGDPDPSDAPPGRGEAGS
jgi:serine/threonine protein kinase